MEIDRTSPLPLYHQLEKILLSKIETGEYGPNERLPAEESLIETYRVSRTTVRQAIGNLVTQGRLYRERGRGTFVGPGRLRLEPSRSLSVEPTVQYHEYKDRIWAWRIVALEKQLPAPEVRLHLTLASDEQVWCITRVRLVDGIPITVEHSYIPVKLGIDFQEEELLHPAGSLSYLKEIKGVALHSADWIFEAIRAPSFEAKLMGISPGVPCMQIRRTCYGPSGPVEFVRVISRGDRVEYLARVEIEEEMQIHKAL